MLYLQLHVCALWWLHVVVNEHPLQLDITPLHLAAEGGHTTCVEHLLSIPGIDVNIKNRVSWYRCRMGRVG